MTELSTPFLIVGLGNPGKEYTRNRHNVGFMLLDRLGDDLQVTFSRRKSNAAFAECLLDGKKVYLAKPQTFMNDSGRSVEGLVRYFHIPESQLLVVYDELDLPTGNIRIRPAGGSGGHRGVRSIIHELGTQEFPRMRIGIGRPPGKMDPADYVLQDFSADESIELPLVLKRAAECVRIFVQEGIQAAMNAGNAI
ncbi:MAG: aminoacyl-tRNA hydrolase [Anaerolineales bacterium]|jgi:PTH1 family peptidyl-tRNA hydrolase